MGKILGIAIKNYGSLKDIKMGQLYSGQTGVPLGNMVAIIGPSGNGKSTLADAFGFIADALTTDVESACDASNRGGYDKLVSQGSNGPIHFEIYYKENSNSRPITYELTIGKDKYDRPYVKDERLRQRRPGNKSGRPLSFLYLIDGKGYAFEGAEGGQDDEGVVTGSKVDVELSDIRKLGIVTLGAMKQYSRIEKFLTFFDLFPIFKTAKEQLEQIEKKLMFYTVTPEQENKAIDALKFKEELCGPHGVLLLGKLLDPNGNELEATDSTIIKLAQEQSEASLSYQDEIPWGVCRLLQLFQGTNYQDI